MSIEVNDIKLENVIERQTNSVSEDNLVYKKQPSK